MRKILSIIICSVLLLSLFAMTSLATPKITLDEAEELIRQMVAFKGTITSDGELELNYIVVSELPATLVTDEALLKQLHEKSHLRDYIKFYKLDGEYGKASFWYDHMKKFLTEEYIDENLMLARTLWQIGDNVYTPDGIGYAVAPNYPYLTDKGIRESITLVDDDTVIFEALYAGDGTKYEIDFEYTENGWRISDGQGARKFLGAVWKDAYAQNPETGDGVTVIIACLAVSMLGVGITVKKRRYTNIA